MALGVILRGLAKILENMEIAHNVLHAQWDWMKDPEIQSNTWEWDTMSPSDRWMHSHTHDELQRFTPMNTARLKISRAYKYRAPKYIASL